MQSRQSGFTQEKSATKAGVSVRSGRRIENGGTRAKAPRHWLTRSDTFASVWAAELVLLLEKEPKLSGLTLWEYLDKNYPGAYSYKLLRTLQRRVKHWRATQGSDNQVMFRQAIPPGQQDLSDFTHSRNTVTVAGQPFPHLIYQSPTVVGIVPTLCGVAKAILHWLRVYRMLSIKVAGFHLNIEQTVLVPPMSIKARRNN